ncbi:aspartate--tRNA ligase dps1 [Coemansia sp. RSA 1813]|nr:aspartate--tRNA ligase dps1 [Coemansia sp. RSA 1646]KAJ1772390.1 aspartate--tRNA ligase dps1 [Coemansia sp. RSA 1843]KAJ2091113.1 aspartate--tRNA ligase dps1 [Coemansia sp. RSA 986]KAJ2212117.1 aspartate--tRNA ligase dps1 [Coemansia sp. RSA 487]KAJ2571165.1 aspartate--tRNA ligase dps1 [Coemansia sp. RSA 1813]
MSEQEHQQQQQNAPASVDEVTNQLQEVVLGPDGNPLSKKALKKLEKEREKEQKKKERLEREAIERAAREAAEGDCAADKYGKAEINMSQKQTNTEWTEIKNLSTAMAGQIVNIQARVQNSRPTGNKMCFLVLREGTATVQGLVDANREDIISKKMVKFANSIPNESIVSITAEVTVPREPVKSCTVGDVELTVNTLFVTSEVVKQLPFSIEDASRSKQDYEKDPTLNKVHLDTRLDNRVIDLRTITNNAIFKIQAAVGHLFREYLSNQKFTEIHSPKIIGTASEGGSNVFQVTYFKRHAYLAQSPQLYKQACIAADFGRVYEVAPVFRAEDSNTYRHLTEYVGLDLECSFREHYHEVMYMIGDMFVYIFKNLESRWAHELEVIRQQYPSEPIKFDEKPLRLEYKDAIALLRKHGVEIEDLADLTTPQERELGKLVKKEYNTDFYMLDKFPLGIRPFYTMPDPTNPNYSNSYDFFLRGEEIMSGAQRIHDPALLTERIKALNIEPESLADYIKGFEYGCPPHAGGGVGLERVVMFYLGIGNIRNVSLFPRDPKRVEP